MTALGPDTGRTRSPRARRALGRLLAGLLATIVATTLVACGGGTLPSAAVTQTVAQTTPGTTSTPAAATPTSTAPARRSRARSAAPATTHRGAAGGGTSAPPAGSPRHGASAQTRMITACLAHVGLARAREQNAGLWGGEDPTTGGSLLVDGPYKTKGAADTSAGSLNGVEFAERGGRYVVSATLKSHLGAVVHAVARCLDRAGTSAPSSGGSLSF